jgi:tetratricopeptide (TPR) repeat protein
MPIVSGVVLQALHLGSGFLARSESVMLENRAWLQYCAAKRICVSREVEMEYKLKHISTNGISEAIAKAELYRSLSEPEEAESICRDILSVEPQHQLALRLLGLALTDQFTSGGSDRFRETEEIFQLLANPYERLYYTGILYERSAKAQLKTGHAPRAVLTLFELALQSFAEAEKIRPTGNDDAILRWNRCVRLLLNPTYGWEKLEFEGVGFEAADTPPR